MYRLKKGCWVWGPLKPGQLPRELLWEKNQEPGLCGGSRVRIGVFIIPEAMISFKRLEIFVFTYVLLCLEELPPLILPASCFSTVKINDNKSFKPLSTLQWSEDSSSSGLLLVCCWKSNQEMIILEDKYLWNKVLGWGFCGRKAEIKLTLCWLAVWASVASLPYC